MKRGCGWSLILVPVVLADVASGLPCAGVLADPLPNVPISGVKVSLAPVSTGLDAYVPTDIVAPDDGSGRLFISTIQGILLSVASDGQVSQMLDTTGPDTLINPARFGMISVALHPDFAEDGTPGYRRFYTITTEHPGTAPGDFGGNGGSHQDVVHEWMIDANDPNAVDMTSRRELLRIGQPNGDHNLSDIEFLADGSMLIAVGDGRNSPAGQPQTGDGAQDISTIFGSVIRIDPLGVMGSASANGQYSIPGDNPFVATPGAVTEIYAYGFRSPYRLHYDAESGRVFVGDVGQLTIEELSILEPGGNHGWNVQEGTFLFDRDTYGVCVNPSPDPTLVNPIAQYDHNDGRSIVGGVTYRGTSLPIAGLHLFGDFLGGSASGFNARLFVTNPQVGGAFGLGLTDTSAPLPFFIYTIGVDAQGEVLVAGTTVSGEGRLLRIIGVEICPGDITGTGSLPDGSVDIDDLNLILSVFGTSVGVGHPADLANDDGLVNIDDMNIVLSNFGAACSS